jgi:hypothetical protein
LQQRLPGAADPTLKPTTESTATDKPVYDKNLVRTNSKEQKIVKYFESFDVHTKKPDANTTKNIFSSSKFIPNRM